MEFIPIDLSRIDENEEFEGSGVDELTRADANASLNAPSIICCWSIKILSMLEKFFCVGCNAEMPGIGLEFAGTWWPNRLLSKCCWKMFERNCCSMPLMLLVPSQKLRYFSAVASLSLLTRFFCKSFAILIPLGDCDFLSLHSEYFGRLVAGLTITDFWASLKRFKF